MSLLGNVTRVLTASRALLNVVVIVGVITVTNHNYYRN